MKKIKTIFERDWNGTRKVIPVPSSGVSLETLELDETVKATEKVDGMNVRITIRNQTVVRVEKRRNPSKMQKAQGIEEPWYVDIDEFGPEDKYIREAVSGREYEGIHDGEWSGECYGLNIQGNPLGMGKNHIMLFSCGEAPIHENVPTEYNALKTWLETAKSKVGHNCGIEGIVWHLSDGKMFKIKRKDF